VGLGLPVCRQFEPDASAGTAEVAAVVLLDAQTAYSGAAAVAAGGAADVGGYGGAECGGEGGENRQEMHDDNSLVFVGRCGCGLLWMEMVVAMVKLQLGSGRQLYMHFSGAAFLSREDFVATRR
jgi:hypothetical protein